MNTIQSVVQEYFQKSSSFLLPLLRIRKGPDTSPDLTYVAWEDIYTEEDCKLLCHYRDPGDFIDSYLTGHDLFDDKLILEDGSWLYVFDLSKYKTDYGNFLKGRYSMLSDYLKMHIRDYFGEQTIEYLYMSSYLYPLYFFDNYADLLNERVDTLIAVGELCDKYDREKETLKISIKKLENSVISA